ncbi:Inositol-1,4,5-trisphosphate 5-phosphatase 1, partial [Massospora cicadina]
MGSTLDVYIQNTPKRRLAIVSRGDDLVLPLYVSLDDRSPKVVGVDMTLGKAFEPSEWHWANQIYGYLGNVALATAEVFAVFVTAYTPIAKLPCPKLDNTTETSHSSKDLAYVYHIDRRSRHLPNPGPDGLDGGGYDSEPEVVRDSDDGMGFVQLDKGKLTRFRSRASTRANSFSPAETVGYPYDELKKLLMTQNFYASNHDFLWNASLLTCHLQLLDRVSRENPELSRKFIHAGLMTPVIQGHVDTFYSGAQGEVATLISRVGWKRAGTRFHARGIDDEGYTANFVETELVVADKRRQFGFTTVRGSVPAFWTQEGNQLLGHRIQLTRGLNATQPACDLHLAWLANRYGGGHIINLLGQRENSAEANLSLRFEQLVAKSRTRINFTNFDFHALSEATTQSPWLLSLRSEPACRHLAPAGVVRTNCLDCLDRTNVIQGLLLDFALENFDVPLPSHLLKRRFATACGGNGDAISRIYAGTGALQSGVAATGKASIVNRLQDASKSVSRLYLHHFHDREKQEAINILLCRGTLLHSPVQAGCRAALVADDPLWHVQRQRPYPQWRPLVPWLTPPKGGKLPDVYALAFEEIVELTPSQILAADDDTSILWESLLSRDLAVVADGRTEYALLTSEQLVGICLFIYVKRDLLSFMHQVMRCTKKTGLLGMAGNKGAAAIRFRCHDASFCFVACHFASGKAFLATKPIPGQSRADDRNRDFSIIQTGILFPGFGGINQHDAVFYLGDFNYRINLTYDHVHNALHHGQLSALLKRDQLFEAQRYGAAFSGFREGRSRFRPRTSMTSVLTPTTPVRSAVSRHGQVRALQPRLTLVDRILFRGAEVNQEYYNRCLLFESDHRPVAAGFVVSARRPITNLAVPPTPRRKPPITKASTVEKKAWWDYPLLEEVPSLDELDRVWRSHPPTNPFRQLGLKEALTRVYKRTADSSSSAAPTCP